MNGIKLDVGHRYKEGRMSFIKTWRSCSRDKSSSPGDDGISYQFLYQLSRNGTHHLLNLFNVAWSHCKLPTTWKHARKIPIPKSTDRTACRPISLLSCVGKKKHGMNIPEQTKIQYTRPSPSPLCTSQTFKHLRQYYHSTIPPWRPKTILAMLDLKKAFELADPTSITAILAEKGEQVRLLGWVQDYLTDRS